MRRIWGSGAVLVGLLLVVGCDRRATEINRVAPLETINRTGSREDGRYDDGGSRRAYRGRLIRVSSEEAAKITPEVKAEAESIFDDRCTACHGSDGDGKGPASASLKPGPKDFRDAKWQKSISDEKITKAIISGGEAVGLSAGMPGNPDLEEKPEVVAALVAHVRSFGK
jgi:mono/diheme cytochrome c family protein